MYYKIEDNIIRRKEKWNFMVLLPIDKKFIVYNELISLNISNDWIIKSNKVNANMLNILIKNNAVKKTEIQEHVELDLYNKNYISAPLNVTIQITDRCNLRCIHCHKTTKWFVDLSYEGIKKLVDNLRELKVFNINISGWEPILNKDVFKICEYIKNKWINFTMSSNLTLRNNEIAQKLSNLWLKNINISLDSDKSDNHDKIRWIKWAFDKMINNLCYLKDNNIEFMFVSTIVNQLPQEYSKIIDLSYKLWAKWHKTNTLIAQWFWNSLKNKSFYIKDFEEYINVWKNKKNEYSWRMNVIAETMFQIQIWKEYISPANIPNALNCWCPAWILTAAINEKWDVLLCPFFTDISIWNIHKDSFKDIWNNDIIKTYRMRSDIEKCWNCNFVNICWGCKARSFGLYKTFKKKDPYCFLYK